MEALHCMNHLGNGDGRRKMGGEVINFFVDYEVDGDTSFLARAQVGDLRWQG